VELILQNSEAEDCHKALWHCGSNYSMLPIGNTS
jgi:hypothetical protein